MKVPPKRKGNLILKFLPQNLLRLNESPSEKEGKYTGDGVYEIGD